jgi:hypothetical protein
MIQGCPSFAAFAPFAVKGYMWNFTVPFLPWRKIDYLA